MTGFMVTKLTATSMRSAVAETVGTFTLVLAIGATAAPGPQGEIGRGHPVWVGSGCSGGWFRAHRDCYELRPCFGAHVNPAVTIGLAVTRRFPWMYVPAYVAAQFVGSVSAVLVIWYVNGPPARSIGHLGATQPSAGIGAARVLVAEGVVTFLLVLVVISVATDPRVPRAGAAVAIGLALSVAIFIAGPISGGGVNPARALGPMVVAARFTDWWAYILGPIVGGTAATVLYEKVLCRGAVPALGSPAAHDG